MRQRRTCVATMCRHDYAQSGKPSLRVQKRRRKEEGLRRIRLCCAGTIVSAHKQDAWRLHVLSAVALYLSNIDYPSVASADEQSGVPLAFSRFRLSLFASRAALVLIGAFLFCNTQAGMATVPPEVQTIVLLRHAPCQQAFWQQRISKWIVNRPWHQRWPGQRLCDWNSAISCASQSRKYWICGLTTISGTVTK